VSKVTALTVERRAGIRAAKIQLRHPVQIRRVHADRPVGERTRSSVSSTAKARMFWLSSIQLLSSTQVA